MSDIKVVGDINDVLNRYFELQGKIYNYFGYSEDWQVIPICDNRNVYWCIKEEWSEVWFWEEDGPVWEDQEWDPYINWIYYYRHLNRWVYRSDELTMVVVDTQTDGNKFLQIFDNARERKQASMKEEGYE